MKLTTSFVTLSLRQVVLKGSCLSNPVLECRLVKVQITLYGFSSQSTLTRSLQRFSFHFGWPCTPLTPVLLQNTSFSSVPSSKFGNVRPFLQSWEILGSRACLLFNILSSRCSKRFFKFWETIRSFLLVFQTWKKGKRMFFPWNLEFCVASIRSQTWSEICVN